MLNDEYMENRGKYKDRIDTELDIYFDGIMKWPVDLGAPLSQTNGRSMRKIKKLKRISIMLLCAVLLHGGCGSRTAEETEKSRYNGEF